MKFNTIQIVSVVVSTIFQSHHIVLANVNDTNSTQNNDAEKHTRSEMTREDDITCHQNSTYVWCIPMDYSNRKEPWRYKDTIGATFPWFYHFKFTIFDIEEVNDRDQTVRMSMYFNVKWLEPRIVINEAATDWNDTKYGLAGSVNVAPEILKKFWNPDIELYRMEQFRSQSILKAMSSLSVKKNRYIEYESRVDIQISCRMNFDRYPLDTQECPFRIGSYYSSIETVNCTETYVYNKNLQRSLQYSIEIDPLPEKYRELVSGKKRYAVCGVNILLSRTKKQTFFQVYLPSMMFVAVSWVSFLIKPDIVPGRMALLVTMLLVLINVFNGVKAKAPKSTDLNAVDLYLVVCIGTVFLALFEYALVLLKEKCRSHEKLVRPLNKTNTNRLNSGEQANPEVIQAWAEKRPAMNRLDVFSLVLFPVFFTVFNVFYVLNHGLNPFES